jgi:hypothetical protein
MASISKSKGKKANLQNITPDIIQRTWKAYQEKM